MREISSLFPLLLSTKTRREISMNELAFATIGELRKKIIRKEISVLELLSYFKERFSSIDPELNAALEIFDQASILKDAHNKEHALSGIPGLIKDTICQRGRITSCASKILANYCASYDATAVERLKKVGALSIGRANCDEFAMGSSGETSAYGPTANPWDIKRVPGGSSSGSAAAVAAGLVPWALGSETGGSVRQPAALCGIVGMKPTYGRVSRFGLVAYASSIDQIGTLTRTIYDNALVLSCIAGFDAKDGTTRKEAVEDYTKNLTGSLKQGLTIGIIENAYNKEGIDSEVKQLLENALLEYERLGAKIKRVKLPLMDYGAAIYFMVSRAEAASNLARFDGVRYGVRAKNVSNLQEMYARTRAQGFGKVVKERILIGNYVLSAGHAEQYYQSAKKVQSMLRAQFLEAFKDVDLLFSPVSPTPAFKFGQVTGLELDLQDYFTAPANLVGIPALSVPCGFTKEGLPVGLQLFGPDLSEGLLYQTGFAYEQVTGFYKRYPQL